VKIPCKSYVTNCLACRRAVHDLR